MITDQRFVKINTEKLKYKDRDRLSYIIEDSYFLNSVFDSKLHSPSYKHLLLVIQELSFSKPNNLPEFEGLQGSVPRYRPHQPQQEFAVAVLHRLEIRLIKTLCSFK